MINVKQALKDSGRFDKFIDLALPEERLPSLVLNDRGMRQAFDQGRIYVDTPIDDKQIQPASLDCRLSVIERNFTPPSMECFGKPEWDNHPFSIPKYGLVDVSFTQHFKWDTDFWFPQPLLRSSLGRVGVAPFVSAVANFYHHRKNDLPLVKSGIQAANYSPNHIRLKQNDRFCQLMWHLQFNRSGFYEDLEPSIDKYLNCVKELETGMQVLNERAVREMCDAGLFSMEPFFSLRNGLLELHASSEAYRFKDVGYVDISEKRKDLLEPVDITGGYTPKPGEHLLVKAAETINLSEKIGVHFLERPFGAMVQTEREMQRGWHVANTTLVNAAWFDPGYNGIYMAHIKNTQDLYKDVQIRPGDLIGLGVVYYYPNGVERPYGSEELGSHYQGARDVRVLQED
jgi:deoxycytidine triphosphate deaminase